MFNACKIMFIFNKHLFSGDKIIIKKNNSKRNRFFFAYSISKVTFKAFD